MDVDVFGQQIAAGTARVDRTNYDVFDSGDDLSPGERQLVAAWMRDLVNKESSCVLSGSKRAIRLTMEAERYAQCGNRFLLFQCPRDYLRYYIRAFCQSRICERCSRIYAKDLRGSILPVVRAVGASKKRGYLLAQLTLTVTSARYGDKLPDRDGIKRLYRESSAFLRRFYGAYAMVKTRAGRWREDRRRYIGAGWLATVEVGRDNNNLHVHALVYGPIRSFKRLRIAWSEITGDSFGVDVRKKTPRDAVSYVLKYIAKPPATDSYQRIAEYAVMIKGTRRLRSGGIFYNRFIQKQPESRPCCCLVCGDRLRYTGESFQLHGQLIDFKRGLSDSDFALLALGSRELPGEVTPVSLSF